MLQDPLNFSIDGGVTQIPLNRIVSSGQSAKYASADDTLILDVSHQVTKKDRRRRLVKITWKAVVTDPLTSENDYDQAVMHLVIDEPGFGFSDSVLTLLFDGLTTLATDNLQDILEGQS